MQLTPQTVNAYKTILSNPSEHGFNFKPITEWFEKTDFVTANHLLFEQVLLEINVPLPKVIFYILMEELHGPSNGKDGNGSLGYKLKLNQLID